MSPDLEVRDKMQAIGKGVEKEIPPGWGFAVWVFPLDDREGRANYVSNAQRESLFAVIMAWLKRSGAKIEHEEEP